MNNLTIFESPEFGAVRTVELVGKDVAEALGYTNPRKALADHVDDEDKGVTKCYTPGGDQDMTIINESGLYSLVLSSKLPTARKFRVLALLHSGTAQPDPTPTAPGGIRRLDVKLK